MRALSQDRIFRGQSPWKEFPWPFLYEQFADGFRGDGQTALMKPHPYLILGLVISSPLLRGAVPDYTLHEWGTFTTVIGSDGTHLDGAHLEDAPLPNFVYGLDQPEPNLRGRTKALDLRREFAHVNVRLETPVIYFYSEESFDVQVDVGFMNGSIGQWYPDRSAGEARPPQPTLDFAEPRQGAIRWNVRVEPTGEDAAARFFRSGELPCWLYPRYPDSALVTNARGETEKYLFYRGLGRMALPISFAATNHVLTVSNTGKEEIAQWLVYDLNYEGEARWWRPDSLAPASEGSGPAATISLEDQDYRSDWKADLYADGVEMLMTAGLFRAEADAMMQTWWTSYFEAPGLRVFWIVPRKMVDEVLPLSASPAPKKTERVIVGRSEILRPWFERRLVEASSEPNHPLAHDRFFPAYSARIEQLRRIGPLASDAVPSPPASELPRTEQ